MNTTLVKDAKFEDVLGHWAEAEIDTLSNMGIVKGATDDSFTDECGLYLPQTGYDYREFEPGRRSNSVREKA
ncbi:S-layer homology domain-containing protein [Paenibacillus sp. N3.4]|uniref:S-layer homology domain-containing protein n=1 Tax=Paenibacillus sp. N3.4 TaxID=2603222 RepID=UPI0011CB214E|nr:S-layer homology domain-containing protein [Paenibacillus sp. N3.4]